MFWIPSKVILRQYDLLEHVNPNLYGGGGEFAPSQAVFLPQLKNGWR